MEARHVERALICAFCGRGAELRDRHVAQRAENGNRRAGCSQHSTECSAVDSPAGDRARGAASPPAPRAPCARPGFEARTDHGDRRRSRVARPGDWRLPKPPDVPGGAGRSGSWPRSRSNASIPTFRPSFRHWSRTTFRRRRPSKGASTARARRLRWRSPETSTSTSPRRPSSPPRLRKAACKASSGP